VQRIIAQRWKVIEPIPLYKSKERKKEKKKNNNPQ
jgi:hypothetical protein